MDMARHDTARIGHGTDRTRKPRNPRKSQEIHGSQEIRENLRKSKKVRKSKTIQESQEKFKEYQPSSIYEAKRIAGINPADLLIVIGYLDHYQHASPTR